MNSNHYFASHAESYAERITSIQPEFYQNAGRLLNAYLPDGGRVLDIGNGGVINYDYSRLAHLDCADLAVSQTAAQKYAACPNIRFIQGDVLNLPETLSASYDVVIMQAVIHHLAGATYKETLARINTAVAECLRVLRPGGLLLIVESTVVPWFETAERFTYPLMQAFFALCRFGHVYQFSPQSLARLLRVQDHTEFLLQEKVEVGRSIWIMGKSIPARLTPCGATFYVLERK